MNHRQTVVLFDAVGTVIKPVPGVIDVYDRLGHAHGSQLATAEIKRRIKVARKKHFHVGTDTPVGDTTDFPSDDRTERQLWKRLVLDVFDDVSTADDLFNELWNHFDQAESWQLYTDVQSCWAAFREKGCLIGLASNFDSRLLSICKQIPTLDSADFVFHSASVGFRKPSRSFYRNVEKAIHQKVGPANILMIGDDLKNDCVAPNQAGWSSTWLNRNQPSHEPEPNSKITDEINQVQTLIEFCDRVL